MELRGQDVSTASKMATLESAMDLMERLREASYAPALQAAPVPRLALSRSYSDLEGKGGGVHQISTLHDNAAGAGVP